MKNEETFEEDAALAALVQGAFEEKRGLDGKRLRSVMAAAAVAAQARRMRRLVVRWSAAGLLAASVAFAVAFRAGLFDPPAPESEATELEDALGLLCELRGLSSEGGLSDETVGERLQAWQEAPCADLL